MVTELYYFDIYPKVVPAGKTTRMTIQPLGKQSAFPATIELEIKPLNDRNFDFDGREPVPQLLTLSPDADGCLRFDYCFDMESEYFICFPDKLFPRIHPHKARMCVYAVLPDLQGRYPYLGDTHVHSTHSDGAQAPDIVAADYRKQGLDFLAMTDHHNYMGSMSMIAAYQDVPLNIALIPGEEVHLPHDAAHIISFGATHSVNFMVQTKRDEVNERFPGLNLESLPPETWRGDPDAPCYSEEEYERQVWELADELNLPQNGDRFVIASSTWAARRIKEAGGLAVFPHPYWVNNTFSIPPRVSDVFFAMNEFDAFEVFGGERYLEQNESQLYHYMEARAKGTKLAPVGASDSHSVYNNADAYIGKTLVLSPKNERVELVESMRAGYCIAVECISKEYRLCSSLRLIRYGRFLMEYYFPLHDELCVEEGRLMKAYACGDEHAAVELSRLYGRTEALIRKYFAI